MDGSNLVAALILALIGLYAAAATKSDISLCKISEWKCSNGTCISASKFCDGTADCLDKSDEPNQCTGKFIIEICFSMFILTFKYTL